MTTRFVIQSYSTAIGRRLRQVSEQSGSTMIEFALCSTILFSLMFGVMGFCMAMFSNLMNSEAARAGARYAMVRGNSWTSDCSAPGPANCIAQPADIQTFVKSVTAVRSANLQVTANWLNSSGTSCGTADSCKSPGSRVKVTATYFYNVHIPFLPTQTINMSSSSQMIMAQ